MKSTPIYDTIIDVTIDTSIDFAFHPRLNFKGKNFWIFSTLKAIHTTAIYILYFILKKSKHFCVWKLVVEVPYRLSFSCISSEVDRFEGFEIQIHFLKFQTSNLK